MLPTLPLHSLSTPGKSLLQAINKHHYKQHITQLLQENHKYNGNDKRNNSNMINSNETYPVNKEMDLILILFFSDIFTRQLFNDKLNSAWDFNPEETPAWIWDSRIVPEGRMVHQRSKKAYRKKPVENYTIKHLTYLIYE